ncbi:MAG: hypothetical protein IJF78_04580 [Clostridia bacterium]|nr:hypothetical protein [Clostridia bacterium]
MKKLTAILLAALLLMGCSTGDSGTRLPPYEAVTENTLSESYTYDLSHLVLEPQSAQMTSSMKLCKELADHYPYDYLYTETAPLVRFLDGKTIVLRRYPEEVMAQGTEALWEFEHDPLNAYLLNRIEVYTDHDYTAEPEVIALTGHDEAFTADSFEYLPDRDVFITVTYRTHVSDPRLLTLHTFDGDGNFLSEEDIYPPSFEDNPLTEFRLLNGDLYFDSEDFDLYRYRTDTGEETLIDTAVLGMSVQDGKLLFMKQDFAEDYTLEYRAMEYDPVTGDSRMLMLLGGDIAGQHIKRDTGFHMAYDYENSILYYGVDTLPATAAHGIRTYREGDENYTQVLIRSDPSPVWIEDLQIHDGHLTVTFGRNHTLIYKLSDTPAPADEGKEPLNLCLYGVDSARGYRSDAFSLMEAAGYPAKPMGTYLSSDEDEYAFTMAKKLMAGDNDFDIFMVNTSMWEIMKEGFYEDLSGYSVLDRMYGEMYPGIKRICTIGDTPALWPVILYTNVMYTDNSLADTGAPSVFGDLPGLRDTVLPSLTGDGTCFMADYSIRNLVLPWFRQFAANYMGRDMGSRQAEEDLLSLYRTAAALMDGDGIVTGEDYASAKPWIKHRKIPLQKANGVRENQTVSVLPPAMEGYAQVIEGTFFAINPNSPRKETAAVFLACIAELNRLQTADLFDIRFDDTVYADGSEESAAVQAAQLASGIRYQEPADLLSMLTEHMEAIQSGTLTAEDAAEEMLRYLKMLKNE